MFRIVHTVAFATSFTLAMTLSPAGTAEAQESNVELPRYPSISPDGETIVFSWRGDLWKVDADGGVAIRLTSHPGNDHASAWSRDGSHIAFESDRLGPQNLFIMTPDGAGVRRVTVSNNSLSLIGFGADANGEEVLSLASYLEGDVYRSPRPYMVDTDGGKIRRIHDAFGTHPSISPDGKRVAFTRGGSSWSRRHYRGPDDRDVWIFDRTDGRFHQVTDWTGNDGKARWASDRELLYLSDREDDTVNLYRMVRPLSNNPAVERLTHFTDNDIWDYDVAADGSRVVFVVWDTLYTLELDASDAKPEPVAIFASEDAGDNFDLLTVDRRVDEASLSPDGKVMAVAAYGEIYVRNVEDGSPTRRVTDSHARDRGIAWSPDGTTLYFYSDRSGTDSIYAATVALTRSELKEGFREQLGLATKAEAPEATSQPAPNDTSGTTRPATPARPDDPVSGVWRGVASIPDQGDVAFTMTLQLNDEGSVSGNVDAIDFSGPVSGTFDASTGALELTLSFPDGQQVGLSLRVEGGAMSGVASATGLTVAITATRDHETSENSSGAASGAPVARHQQGDADDDASSDAKTDDQESELPKEHDPSRWHDAWTFNIAPVVDDETNTRDPRPSPDGKYLSFRRGRGDIVLLNLADNTQRTLVTGWDTRIDWRWSPDATRIAYSQNDRDFNADVWVVDVDGTSSAVNVSMHPDNDFAPRWNGDGTMLVFTSERVNEEYDIFRVLLDREIYELGEVEMKEYYERAKKAAGKRSPLPPAPRRAGKTDLVPERPDLELDDAYLRVERMTSLVGSEFNNDITPAGDRIIFSGSGPYGGLWSINWQGGDRTRLAGGGGVQHLTLKGDKVVMVSGGRAATVGTGGGSVAYHDIDARMRIDLEKQASQKFLEAARILGEVFYHPTMKDLNWDAITRRYHALAKNARTAEEFEYVAAYLLGELNGSHLGINAPSTFNAESQSIGDIGISYTVVNDGFKVTHIVPDSPADQGEMALEVGDVITAVNFQAIQPGDTMDRLLEGRVGQETAFDLKRTIKGRDAPAEVSVILTPSTFGRLRGLIYQAWQLENQRQVEEWSNGRVGYIHIQGMNIPSLNEFERDLFAAAHNKDGLIVDVRNNGGGHTADYVLSSIMVQPHAYTVPRGADPSYTGGYPQDRLYIQRYTQPMNMLCNEKSFSNAEIVSHAFKTLDRGNLVGEETYGGVISTGGETLIDGTRVRTPFRGWYVVGGMDMENNGAVPDIRVPQTPEDESRDFDAQLKAAVDDLMKRLDE